ncbi:hypothetical protein HMPREF1978_00505 [Actinomyces graevenitzii F0530]|uniref:Uncharacterized protein n=1 Tax=Actinomyces graevenitzii F0530 TaxID=1321817 RepID=U1Q5M9_9ACTO|nr:hypothetical protein HMPREF1978_00505 [Actinomyces graevenitzii F0530]
MAGAIRLLCTHSAARVRTCPAQGSSPALTDLAALAGAWAGSFWPYQAPIFAHQRR